MSDTLTALLELVANEEGVSAARACKRLGLSRSELQRLLTALGDDEALGGLNLVRIESDGTRDALWLSTRAREARGAA